MKAHPMIKKIASSVVMSISLIVFGLAIYIMIFGTIAMSNQRLFKLFGYSYGMVPTISMEGPTPENALPGFKQGSIIYVESTPFESLELYDIVVFQSKEGYLKVHRIVEIKDGYYITKGDHPEASKDIDDPVTPANYQGKVFKSVTFFGIGTWINDVRGIILMVLIIIIIGFILWQIYHLVVMYHRKKEIDTIVSDEEIKRLADERIKERKEN